MLRKKKLPHELQMRVLKYLEFIWEQENTENAEQENLLMSKLSSKLRDEIYLHTNVKHLRRVKAFSIFSDKTLIKLASHMRKMRFSPEEYVYKPMESDDSSVYFVIDGKLEIATQKDPAKLSSKISWGVLKENDYFGIRELITGEKRETGVLSIDFSSLFQLSRTDFLNTLKRNPEDYEKYCMLRDDIMLYKQMSRLNINCKSCSFNDHEVQECRFFKYKPNILTVIGRHGHETKKFYKTFQRKGKRTNINTLYRKSRVQEDHNDFLAIYKDDEDFKEYVSLYVKDGKEFIQDSLEKKEHSSSKITDDQIAIPFPLSPKRLEESGFMFNSFVDNEYDKRRETMRVRSPRRNQSSKRKLTLRAGDNQANSFGEAIQQLIIHNSEPQLHPHIPEVQIKAISDLPKELKVETEEGGCLLDLKRSYVHYFPHNNLEKILYNLNKKRRKLIASRRRNNQVMEKSMLKLKLVDNNSQPPE